MINIGLVIQNILYLKGPMTRNQIFDELVRKTGIRETRENFDLIVNEMLSKAKIVNVNGNIL